MLLFPCEEHSQQEKGGGAWNIMLPFPCEEHSQQEKGGGAWDIMLLFPCEEHSQQEKGGEQDCAERKLRAILWKIFPKEPEGMCQSVLSPITGKSKIEKIPI